MQDFFSELAGEWTGEAAAGLGERPVPVVFPHTAGLTDAQPSSPPGGHTMFDLLIARWPDPRASMDIAAWAHQRDLARSAQPPVLSVHVDSLASPVTRYEVNPHDRTVAFTVARPPQENSTAELPAVQVPPEWERVVTIIPGQAAPEPSPGDDTWWSA